MPSEKMTPFLKILLDFGTIHLANFLYFIPPPPFGHHKWMAPILFSAFGHLFGWYSTFGRTKCFSSSFWTRASVKDYLRTTPFSTKSFVSPWVYMMSFVSLYDCYNSHCCRSQSGKLLWSQRLRIGVLLLYMDFVLEDSRGLSDP